jgi:hypothetical protein|nr:MAG TPA: hypothetical protein [Caudoviricetes sp.]
MHLYYQNRHDWRDIREVPENWHSLSWTERAYEFGQFELKIFSDMSVPFYDMGNYFMRDDTDRGMIIETVDIEQQDTGVYLHTYTGRSLESVYTWRVLIHKIWIKPDAQKKFQAQLYAQQLSNTNFGATASPERRLPGWTFHQDPDVSQWAYVNDTGQEIQDDKWVVYDRCPVDKPFGDVIHACKPNGYPLYYKVTLEQGNFHTYIRHPRLVETVTLAEKNDNFANFKAVHSIVDSKNVVYEIFDTGDNEMQPQWIADGTTHTRPMFIRAGAGIDRREVLWDNSHNNKPIKFGAQWNQLTPEQQQTVSAVQIPWYPYWMVDSMFPKYTPLALMSGKIDNFSGVEYRQGFTVGDVMYYIPTGKEDAPVEVQITEMTESWSPEGYSLTPAISMASRNKWSGDSFRLNYLRQGPGTVIVPRDGA